MSAPSSSGPVTLPERIEIRDVRPRDGLQPEAPVAVADRLAMVESLVAAGLRRVEAAAFVSPRAVPAMTGGAEVMAGLSRNPVVCYAGLGGAHPSPRVRRATWPPKSWWPSVMTAEWPPPSTWRPW